MKEKILIIEDNEDILDNTVEIMELEGFEVIYASRGMRGVEKAVENIPDLILCDIWMPEMDGYEVFHRLKQNDITANIPFVVFSASVEKSDVEKALEMGAIDYIKKPFTTDQLLDTVRRVLNNSK